VAPERLLREHAVPIDVHLEDPAAGRDDLQGRDVVLQFVEQFGRQTDGTLLVASNCAVLDADAHAVLRSARAGLC
jgi:hypothetical protein